MRSSIYGCNSNIAVYKESTAGSKIMAEVRTDMCKEHPGKEIERLIQADGISRKELADRTGVTEKYVNELLAGENDITEGFARKPGKIFAAITEGSGNHSKDAGY